MRYRRPMAQARSGPLVLHAEQALPQFLGDPSSVEMLAHVACTVRAMDANEFWLVQITANSLLQIRWILRRESQTSFAPLDEELLGLTLHAKEQRLAQCESLEDLAGNGS